MSIISKYDTLRAQIAKNEIKEVLTQMQDLVRSNSDLQNQLILHQSQYNRNKSDGRMGVISREVYLSEENRIKYNLLHIMEDLWESERGPQEAVGDNLGREPRKRIQLVLEGLADDILLHIESIKQELANQAGVVGEDLFIRRVYLGSYVLVVDLPESGAEQLLNQYQSGGVQYIVLASSGQSFEVTSVAYYEAMPDSFLVEEMDEGLYLLERALRTFRQYLQSRRRSIDRDFLQSSSTDLEGYLRNLQEVGSECLRFQSFVDIRTQNMPYRNFLLKQLREVVLESGLVPVTGEVDSEEEPSFFHFSKGEIQFQDVFQFFRKQTQRAYYDTNS